jgi:malate dehydrogenase (oxaloacetate-decarboxylating)
MEHRRHCLRRDSGFGPGRHRPQGGTASNGGQSPVVQVPGRRRCLAPGAGYQRPHRFIQTILTLQSGFGGINLEDIAQPKCFQILDTLRQQAEIPVWHDDQQGTATAILAGLLNALTYVGKTLPQVSIAFVGAGAANIACARLTPSTPSVSAWMYC